MFCQYCKVCAEQGKHFSLAFGQMFVLDTSGTNKLPKVTERVPLCLAHMQEVCEASTKPILFPNTVDSL